MSFAIRFVPPEEAAWELEPHDVRYGLIVIGEFSEHFQVDLEFWRQEDYVRHWRHALERITSDDQISCLITSLGDPRTSMMVFWWPLYRTGDTIRVQNAIRSFDQLGGLFDSENPYPSVPPRRTVSEDGDPISEWSMSVDDVRKFLRTM